MQIVVTLAVEVDPKSWYEVYGREETASGVRQDVKDYVLNTVASAPGILDSEASVELR
ncbi:hypothetical protein ABZ446_28660 [Streptomyces sp. NPDC005813]|uniref:hypothetical protein n=1 Tax=Streptomyces sp. NPDC005813 TaxID=3155592 RepID=UPI0033FFCCE7